MMKHLHIFVCLVLFFTLLASCSKNKAGGEQASISTDKTVISVPSDNLLFVDPFAEKKPDLADTVIVTSTRSWSVVVETSDGGEWVFPNVSEHLNASEKTDKFPLVLTFDRYKGSASRTATVSIFCSEVDNPLTLNIIQEAYKKTLKVEAGESKILPSGGCISYAIVRANTGWAAHLDASSTVKPELSVVSGTETGVIALDFPINVSDELAKVANLVVEAEGCETQTVEFIQKQTKSFFGLAEPVPADIPAYKERIHIPLLSNGPWTAEIKESTFANAQLSVEGGDNCLYGFDFISDHGSDPGVSPKSATIVIRRTGMKDIEVSFRQEGSIHLVTQYFDPDYVWTGTIYESTNPYSPYSLSTPYPFSSPVTLPTKYTSGENVDMDVDLVTLNGGFVFTAHGKDCGCWYSVSRIGLSIGKMAGDYLLLPAVPGKRLSKMYYQASCNAETPYTVRTMDGSTIIKGGEKTWTKFIVPITGDEYDIHEHIFPETEIGARYRLHLEETLRYISVNQICLVYE